MLRYQILVCNEEFVFHVHAAAIKLRSCAECAAHSFVGYHIFKVSNPEN